MSRFLFQIFEQSLSPPACTDDPVVWRRRECNNIDAFAVNYTMDHQNRWNTDFDPITGVDFELVNYVCHSDGGRRSETCAASAWYLEARVSSNGTIRTFPVAMRGIFLDSQVSAFLAEALALEDAILFLRNLLPNDTTSSAPVLPARIFQK